MRIRHTQPPSCDRVFDEDMDTWRVTNDCGNSSCASSTSHSAAGDRPRKD